MIYDLIIIGSGPAGLTAAIYAQRAELSFLVLEKEPVSGGQVVNTYEIDNYPGLPGIGGLELGMRMREQAEQLGAQFINIEARHISLEDGGRIKTVYTDGQEYRARTLILAMGAVPRMLGIPGERELTGTGVSYCAACDGAFYKGRTAAVIGGGDAAVSEALYLSGICAKVYFIYRNDRIHAAKYLRDKLSGRDNVEYLSNTEIVEILGDDGVDGIQIRDLGTASVKILQTDSVFIAAGSNPHTELVTNLLRLDTNGYIPASEDGATEIPGIFAAGDVRTKKFRQIITSAADGANAVSSVEDYLAQF